MEIIIFAVVILALIVLCGFGNIIAENDKQVRHIALLQFQIENTPNCDHLTESEKVESIASLNKVINSYQVK